MNTKRILTIQINIEEGIMQGSRWKQYSFHVIDENKDDVFRYVVSDDEVTENKNVYWHLERCMEEFVKED